MLISDANKGFSGRKRRVGTMRGLISLAVIILIALSASNISVGRLYRLSPRNVP